jgi:transposase-like protein
MVLISIRCPDCNEENITKHGRDRNGKQKYLCLNSDCNRKTFITDYTNKGHLPEIKKQIIEMTLNGSGIRDISRVLKISPHTVINELKKRDLYCKN